MLKLSKYVLYDILRNRIMIAYTLFLLVISFSLFSMEENTSKAILSLLNIVLIVVPLVSMVFATIHWYNSYEFIELMLTQPLSRNKVILSEYFGIGLSLCAAFFIGVGIPVIIYEPSSSGFSLVIIGLILSLCFTSFAFLASVKSKDKARGIGAALLLWFYFALIYDGIIMLILFSFSDYPLEKIILFLLALNPVDLGRVFVMLQMDMSALMGASGAILKHFFETGTGIILTLSILMFWIVFPLFLAIRSFRKKDL